MRKFGFYSVLLLILLTCNFAGAAKLSPVLTGALEFGGDKLVDIVYSDGTTGEIQAGRGFLLGGGLNIDLSETKPNTFEAQLTVGVKWTGSKKASNGEVDWLRFPIELLSFYRNTDRNFRLGAGVTYHFGNKVTGSKDVSSISTKFDNATGFVLEADYVFGAERVAVVGVRFTKINYQAQIPGAPVVSGNSVGINFNYFIF